MILVYLRYQHCNHKWNAASSSASFYTETGCHPDNVPPFSSPLPLPLPSPLHYPKP